MRKGEGRKGQGMEWTVGEILHPSSRHNVVYAARLSFFLTSEFTLLSGKGQPVRKTCKHLYTKSYYLGITIKTSLS